MSDASRLRQHTAPVILSGPDAPSVHILRAVSGGGAPVSEKRLQRVITKHPEIIPITEIEPAFGPLICLGREVPTPAGSADVLYVSPSGYLTLVETKLWRNPQARREVVGQIVDYAKELANWSFEDLDSAVRDALKRESLAGKGIIEILEAEDQLLDESQIIDTITRNLQRGRMLLLIVGDGIREGVESISSYLQDTPGLHFSLALVELALYQLEREKDWPILVQPRVVTRTSEIVRAVVRVHAPPQVDVEVELAEPEKKKTSRRTLTEDVFLEELASAKGDTVAEDVSDLIDELDGIGLVKRWRSSSISMRLPDPRDTGNEFTAVVLTKDGQFYLGWLEYVHTRGGYTPCIGKRYLNKVVKLTGVDISGHGDGTNPADVNRLLCKRDEFLSIVGEFRCAIESEAVELK